MLIYIVCVLFVRFLSDTPLLHYLEAFIIFILKTMCIDESLTFYPFKECCIGILARTSFEIEHWKSVTEQMMAKSSYNHIKL